jgi:hypothetical protein
MNRRWIEGAACAAIATALLAGCGDDGSTADDTGSGGDESGATAGSGSAASEPAELAGITQAHNDARAAVDPPASAPMPPLAWDADLAAIAQGYAEKCVFEHSGAPNLGENLYANTGSTTPVEVVAGWVSEVADYDYATNSCDPNSKFGCGHYTQVVWADSLRLGCGVASCTTNSPFGSSETWQNWVCNYDPPGNWVGEKPYD